MKIFHEFRQFIARGNMVDLAIGVIIGGAFTSLVKSLTSNLINPLIGFFIGKSSNLTNLKWQVTPNLVFTYGAFLNDLMDFIITAFVVFLLIKFLNNFIIKQHAKQEAKVDPQVQLLQEIRDELAQSNQK